MPGDIDTSIKETVESEPDVKHEYICTTLGLAGISVSSFYKQNTLLKSGLSVRKHRKTDNENRQDFRQKLTKPDDKLQKPTKEPTITRQIPTNNLQSIMLLMCYNYEAKITLK